MIAIVQTCTWTQVDHMNAQYRLDLSSTKCIRLYIRLARVPNVLEVLLRMLS